MARAFFRARFQEGRGRGFPAEEGQTARERNIKRTNYICVMRTAAAVAAGRDRRMEFFNEVFRIPT